MILRRNNRIEKCSSQTAFGRAYWIQDGKQEAPKRDRVKSSRWGQWKGQVSDVKKDAYFRENIGSENKV